MNTGKTLFPLLIIWLLVSCFDMKGNEPMPWTEVHSMGIGNIYAPLSSYLNPAALSLSKKRALVCAYENKFLVKQLSTLTACYEQPNRLLDFSVLINYFGYDLYHETRCGLNVSKVLKPGLSLGARIYYYGLQYADSKGLISVVSGDIGLQYLPVDNLRIGFLIQNPFRVSYKQEGTEYDLPVCMEIGAEYQFADAASLLVAVEKDTRYPVCFKAGMSYEIERFLQLRIGVLSSPFMPTGGVGFCFDAFQVDAAFSYHSTLGLSPAISIRYNF
ncbi:MAG: hypothetical protein RR212_11630 [Bacteroidales bacterium]